jgi:hypothetical protein
LLSTYVAFGEFFHRILAILKVLIHYDTFVVGVAVSLILS